MKKWLAIGLFIVLLLRMTICFTEDTPKFLTAQELLARDEVSPYIRLDEDEIPTIFSVVGRREITEAEFSVVSSNGLEKRYVYRSDMVSADLRAYAAHLLENGWEELKAPADAESGDMVYAKPSAYDDQTLTVVVNYSTDGYIFIATKKDGVAWVTDGWTPRMETLTTPEELGKPQPLGESVPSAFEKAGRLSMRDDRMAYASFFQEDYLYVAGIAPDWSWNYETLETYGLVIHGIFLTENEVVCLTDDDDEESNTVLEFFYMDGDTSNEEMETPEEDGAEPFRQFGGPLLRLPDGTLLFGDKFGAIYVREADGSSLRAIPGVRADDFVYYDGFVYFANLDDTITHKSVYDENASEYIDFSYPRLYRVAPDGTGLEQLTDCGVRGLASQGPYIIYQNLEEPFTLPVFEQTGPEILYGPLYCHNADTGEQSALNIQSDMYLPTPYGLAVWYHDFSFEPYDITAELVLHGFDGTSLYRLDAGGAQFIGDACLYGETLCFYSYNWAINWDEDEYEEEIFTVVPLDGEQSGDITLLLDYILIGDAEIPLDAEAVDLNEGYLLYPEPEDLEPLRKLPNLRVLKGIGCGIDDVSEIGKLTNLEFLELTDNSIEDIVPLAGLLKLHTLNIGENYIDDLASLTELINLHTLDISGNYAEDLIPLAALSKLRMLNVTGNYIDSLKPLAGLSNLRNLYISDNPIDDVSPLYDLTNLEELYLYDLGEGLTREAVEALAERLPRTGIYCDFFMIPRLIDDVVPELGPAVPVAGECIFTETIPGAEIAVDGDRIAYVLSSEETPTLHVLHRQEDRFVLEASYTADQPISNVVLKGDTVAYLTGPVNYADPDAVCTLEIGKAGQSVNSMVLGPSHRTRGPYVGPLLLLREESKLLFADNLGALYICGMDGSELDKVTEAGVGNFAYHGGAVYFENVEMPDTFDDVYCRELDEFRDVAFPMLYCAESDSVHVVEELDFGIQGLTFWENKMVYQCFEYPFVFPYGELPEDWLLGMLYVYDAENGEELPLGIASARYVATPCGIAVWHGLEYGMEHESSEARLVLYDYQGRALYALDAQGLCYAPCFVGERELWFAREEFSERDGAYEPNVCLVRVPLDGGAAEVFDTP